MEETDMYGGSGEEEMPNEVTEQPTKEAPKKKKKKGKKKKKKGTNGKKKKDVPIVMQMLDDEKDPKKKNQGNCMQRFASSFQATVIGGIERGFKNYGEFVGRHHWKVVVASLAFGILCSSLFVFMYEEEDDGIKLWLPSGSDFKVHSLLLDEEFGDDQKVRTASLLVVAKDGGNVLTADNMRRIYQLRKDVVEAINNNDTSNMFTDRCEMQLRVTEGVAGLDPDATFPDDVCPALAAQAAAEEESTDKVCTEKHVFEIWARDGNFDTAEDLMKDLTDEQMLEAINTVDISGLTNDDFSASSYLGVNDASKDDNGNILKAQAMILNFVLVGYDTEKSDDDLTDAEKKIKDAVLAWEAYFLNHFRDGEEDDKENFKDIDGVLEVYPKAQRSNKDINDASIASDQNLFIIGYLLVAIYVMIMLGKFNSVEQRIWLSLGGIMAVVLGIGTSYGLCSLFGIWGSQMNMIMPFMLLGIGIDDMFVIVQNFDTLDKEEKWKPRAERMGLAMKHGGVAITITTVTDLLAFGIGASTVLPALSHFCIYATFGIFFVYFYMITFFFGLFCMDVIRSEDTRDACLCCWRKPYWKPNEFSQKSYLTEAFRFYSRTLMKLPCRIGALVLTAVLLGLSIWGVLQLEAEFDENIFIPTGTYLREFMEKQDELFPSGGMWGQMYVVDVPDVYKKMNYAKELGIELSKTGTLDDISGTFGFAVSFERFVNKTIGKDKNYPATALEKTQFYELLAQFLHTDGRSQVDGLRFTENLTCKAEAPELRIFNIPYRHKKYADTDENIAEINKMYDLADKFKTKFGVEDSETGVFPMSGGYFNYVTVEIITEELYRNILLALLCVFIATLFLIADLFASILVCISVFFALVDLGGFMYFWGLSIDTIAAILVTIALGLSVDYSAHIAHAFMVATGSRVERVDTALVDIGPAVLNGGFSTFLAFAMLMTSQSIVFLTFFKIFFLVVVFGLYHGLVFLPVILSFIGPSSSTQIHESSNAVAPTDVKMVKSADTARPVRAKSAFSVTSVTTMK